MALKRPLRTSISSLHAALGRAEEVLSWTGEGLEIREVPFSQVIVPTAVLTGPAVSTVATIAFLHAAAVSRPEAVPHQRGGK